MSQVKELADQVIAAVKAFVAQSIGGVSTRLDEFDTRLKSIPAPLKGDPGEPGKDADPDLIDAMMREAVAALPKPVDGKDADPAAVAELVFAELSKAVSALPHAKDGEPGKNGLNAYEVAVSLGFEGTVHDWMKSLDGKAGEPGASVTSEQVLPELRVELQKAIAALPVPKDGVDGKDSTVTAEDFRTAFEAESAKALLDFERRAQDVLLKAISNIPAPKDGKDGADGLGFDDLEVIHDGERQITFKLVRGEVIKEFTLIIPALIDRGVYRSGQKYAKGDCVSYGGSVWIAQRDTESKPEQDDSFRLSVKRGRDGKDGSMKSAEPSRPVRVG